MPNNTEDYQVNLDQLAKFLKEALENCYLGEFKKSETIERPGFFEMDYADGEWSYRDSFVGFYVSAGQEIIRFQDRPVWGSSYRGGVDKEHYGDKEFFRELEDFLRESLGAERSDDFRPRGPDEFEKGDWRYICEWEGDTTRFKGKEMIFFKGKDVFYHDFFGGIIVGY